MKATINLLMGFTKAAKPRGAFTANEKRYSNSVEASVKSRVRKSELRILEALEGKHLTTSEVATLLLTKVPNIQHQLINMQIRELLERTEELVGARGRVIAGWKATKAGLDLLKESKA